DLRCGFARPVHLSKACDVPKLRRKVAAFLDLFFVEANILPARSDPHETKSQSVRTVLVDQFKRIGRVAKTLRHLAALLVANESREINVAKWNVIFIALGFSRFEFEAGDDHARHPEENDVRRSHENRGRLKFLPRF